MTEKFIYAHHWRYVTFNCLKILQTTLYQIKLELSPIMVLINKRAFAQYLRTISIACGVAAAAADGGLPRKTCLAFLTKLLA